MPPKAKLVLYDPPGRADLLDGKVLREWNKVIERTYQQQGTLELFPEKNPELKLATSFFQVDPRAAGPVVLAKWSADPLSPVTCVGLERARRLCDDDRLGRANVQVEYCESRVVRVADGGRLRPKRVEVTTELREYWVCVAQHDPDKLREMVTDRLGFVPDWDQLYGTNPFTLDEHERKRAFARLVAGNGEEADLRDVPDQPEGPLNTRHLLFMTFLLNGLDNLLQLLLFGAHRYGTGAGKTPTPADPNAIFLAIKDPSFACRRADPAVMAEGQDAALRGDELVLANPPGIYILGFTHEVFRYQDAPVPPHWIGRWRREGPGLHQRLEFGPPDHEPAFLDDIVDTVEQRPLTGGFQVLRQVEVGVRLVRRTPPSTTVEPFLDPGTDRATQPCSSSEGCADILELLDQLEAAPS
ncbi:MAG TPA: hypothetical protein VFU54_13855 [Actinomycetota bacterium]|nr:hypothetical protein [Actinomycetota bacterium]